MDKLVAAGVGVGAVLAGGGVTAGVTYYFTPKYTRVGYEPVQPVPFSHKVHAGQLGMDCRYCHNGVDKSWFSNLPGASTCMNCHSQILKNDPRLAIVRESATNNTPIPWVQIHRCRITPISTTRSTSGAASVAWNATGGWTRWTKCPTPSR